MKTSRMARLMNLKSFLCNESVSKSEYLLNYGSYIGKKAGPSWLLNIIVPWNIPLWYLILLSSPPVILFAEILKLSAAPEELHLKKTEDWCQLENKTGLDYLDLKRQLHMIGRRTENSAILQILYTHWIWALFDFTNTVYSLNLSSVLGQFQPKTLFYELNYR